MQPFCYHEEKQPEEGTDTKKRAELKEVFFKNEAGVLISLKPDLPLQVSVRGAHKFLSHLY